jgi:RNA polymerase sigma-70 factor (ECF subfamily)
MIKVKDGDLDKLGLLFKRYKKQLFMFFYRMNNDDHLSEDLVQNVFMRVLKYRKSFTGKGAFRVWLFHIARNEFYDHYRRNSSKERTDVNIDSERVSEYETEEISRETEENLHLLKLAIDRLKIDRREVIILSKIDGLKYRDIAGILKCTEGTVKSKVFRALAELKEEFTKIRQIYG